MASRLRDVNLPPTRTDETQRRAIWRAKAKARYWVNDEIRQAKIAAVELHRQLHPERVREAKRLTEMRQRRGLQRAYRKADRGGEE